MMSCPARPAKGELELSVDGAFSECTEVPEPAVCEKALPPNASVPQRRIPKVAERTPRTSLSGTSCASIPPSETTSAQLPHALKGPNPRGPCATGLCDGDLSAIIPELSSDIGLAGLKFSARATAARSGMPPRAPATLGSALQATMSSPQVSPGAWKLDTTLSISRKYLSLTMPCSDMLPLRRRMPSNQSPWMSNRPNTHLPVEICSSNRSWPVAVLLMQYLLV
mmetsp:Transcript_102715/g.314217  ORF Transcript_102715/g.314217 Transcript_102715/m.314217 type:complete len:224 (+) Transcript_102715:822-1493(+)